MASLVLTGDTSGQVTLAAPAVAGTNTITLPASTGTAIISDGSANIQFNSGYGSVATAYGCRAWVNFNGTTASPSTIRGSGNVTSVTKNGTGDYTVNLTNAMPDANYGVSISGRQIAASNLYSSAVKSGTTPTASAVNIVSIAATGNAGDSDFIYVAIFR